MDRETLAQLLEETDYTVQGKGYKSVGYDKELSLRAAISSEYPFKVGDELFEFEESERTEGSGDYDGFIWVVKHPKSKTYFAWNGYYCSHNGAEMDSPGDFDIVKQVKRVVTSWETI
tara:strand:+ start:1998 stop:2348 length:351 start_codon:yes stop_codon:yes gene_type:complete